VTLSLPARALILARISDARRAAEESATRDTRGVDGQVADLRGFAGRLGWAVGPDATHVIVENDVSGYRRKWCTLPEGPPGFGRRDYRPRRPELWRAIAMLYSGQADGLVVLDLDRACRDPRDLEDIADAVQMSGAAVDSITGTFRLVSTSDLATARIMVAVASKSSSDTARRVKGAREKDSRAGKFTGGPRPYGLRLTGQPGVLAQVPGEAEAVKFMAGEFLAGVSLRQVALALRAKGSRTSKGGDWTAAVVRGVLLNPAIAGLARYRPVPPAGKPRTLEYRMTRDDVITGPACWPPIIDPDTWRAIRARLTDPSRTTSPGPAAKWLVSLIAVCGACGQPVSVRTSHRGKPVYRCPDGHVSRQALDVDDLVSRIVRGRLSWPDLQPGGRSDLGPLKRQAAAIRDQLDELGRLYAQEEIGPRELASGSKALRARLQAIENQLGGSAEVSPLEGVTGANAGRWDELSLGHKREIVRRLVSVEILPVPDAGKQGFDPRFVKITRKS